MYPGVVAKALSAKDQLSKTQKCKNIQINRKGSTYVLCTKAVFETPPCSNIYLLLCTFMSALSKPVDFTSFTALLYVIPPQFSFRKLSEW